MIFRLTISVVTLLFVSGLAPLHAADDALLEEGRGALASGVAEVAVRKLQDYLLTKPAKARVLETRYLLVEAMLQSGDVAGALTVVKKLPADSAQTAFLTGQVHAAGREWEAALSGYEQAAKADDVVLVQAARCGQAESLSALGRDDEALEVLEAVFASEVPERRLVPAKARQLQIELLLDKNQIASAEALLESLEPTDPALKKKRDYQLARVYLQQGRYLDARELFQALIEERSYLSEGIFAGGYLGLAMAYAQDTQDSRAAEAEGVLESFINDNPDSPYLREVFRELDRINSENDGDSSAALKKWAKGSAVDRQILARFYRARHLIASGDQEKASVMLRKLYEAHPGHPLVLDALLELVGLRIDAGDADAAVKILAVIDSEHKRDASHQGARRTFLKGRALFAQGKFNKAAKSFHQSAEMDEGYALAGSYNEALAYLSSGDSEAFIEAYKTFSLTYPESPFRRDLVLEKGLLEARNNSPAAEESLALFVKDFADHPRVSDALIALAEVRFFRSPPDLEKARSYLDQAVQHEGAGSAAEQADYLTIFLAEREDPGATEKILELAQTFLVVHPKTKHTAAVRMKLGEIYFRSQDFLNAQTQFELVVNKFPQSELYERALYFAGQSAMKTMNPEGVETALELFEQVVRLEGALKFQSRLAQAILKAKQDDFAAAVTICDVILADKVPTPLRYDVLLAKGDALYAQANADAKFYKKSIHTYDQLIKEAAGAPMWRNQAFWKKGQALEKIQQPNEALVAYFDAFATKPVRDNPEYFWFYKAAFDAGRILEAQQKWISAIGIYRRLASIKGPRAQEAKERLNRLRLEHFLWEEY